MLWLIISKSCCEADQYGLVGKPCDGGGPEIMKGSGAVVDEFEFPARNVGGGLEKSMLSMYAGLAFLVVRVGCFPPFFEMMRFGDSFEFPLFKTMFSSDG